MTASTIDLPASSTDASIAAAVGRFMVAAIFLLSGFGKLADPAGTIGYVSSAGLPLPQLAYATAVAVELLGGALLVIGYRTRVAAGALAVFTVAAAFGFHLHFADQNQFLHFFKNLAMAGGLLQIAAFGAGALSVDGRVARR